MRRLPLPLIFCGLLCGAAPIPVLTPDHPTLGSPLLVTIPLPDGETDLAGLPDLGSFALIAPPQRQEGGVRILLLPMRPGEATLPSFPLLQGRSRELSTPAVPLEVADGVAEDAVAAPLRDLPAKGARPLPLWPRALLAAAALALGGWWIGRRLRPSRPAGEDQDPAARLARLQRRLERADDFPGRDTLAGRLEVLRFAPVPPRPGEIEELEEILQAGSGEGR